MEITQHVAKAAGRLITRYCTDEERQQPPPSAAVLISRVLTAATSRKPAADTADLRLRWRWSRQIRATEARGRAGTRTPRPDRVPGGTGEVTVVPAWGQCAPGKAYDATRQKRAVGIVRRELRVRRFPGWSPITVVTLLKREICLILEVCAGQWPAGQSRARRKSGEGTCCKRAARGSNEASEKVEGVIFKKRFGGLVGDHVIRYSPGVLIR